MPAGNGGNPHGWTGAGLCALATPTVPVVARSKPMDTMKSSKVWRIDMLFVPFLPRRHAAAQPARAQLCRQARADAPACRDLTLRFGQMAFNVGDDCGSAVVAPGSATCVPSVYQLRLTRPLRLRRRCSARAGVSLASHSRTASLGDNEPAGQEHLRRGPRAQLVAQAPEHHDG